MRMLTRLITTGCMLATCCSTATSSARSQWGAVTSNPVMSGLEAGLMPLQPIGRRIDPLAPSPGDTMRVYQEVEKWVRAWQVSDQADGAAPTGVMVGGVSVVLRLGGEIVGRGTLFAWEWGGSGAELADASEGTRRAARAAIIEAEQRLKIDNDALRSERIRLTASDVMISLELAGRLVPVEPGSFDDIERDYSAGLDGVAVRVGDRLEGAFPATLMGTNTSLRLAVSRVVSQASGDASMGLDEPRKVREQIGATYYRFRVTHVAQRSPRAGAGFLVRGARVIDQSEITTAELHAIANRAADHLRSREHTADGAYGLKGLYEPWSNEYASAFAGSVDQLTAVYALRVYVATPGIDASRALAARSLAARILRALRTVEPDESPASDSVVSSSLWIVADAAAGTEGAGAATDTESTQAPVECRRAVLASFNKLDGFAGGVPIPARGLVAFALVELAAQEQGGALREEAIGLAESAVRRVFLETPEELLISQMPWLGFAERRLAQIKQVHAGPATELPSAVALRRMRSDLWKHQIQVTDAEANESLGGSADLAGAILLNVGGSTGRAAGGSGATPKNATWQAAQVIAFIPVMISDHRLTSSDERPMELARLLMSLRYLRQLQVDETAGWMMPMPRRAIGGVRATLWDHRLPTDAASMTLLAVSQTLRAMDEIVRTK